MKQRAYTTLITDFFKRNPEIAMSTFNRKINFNHHVLRDAFYHNYLLKEDDIFQLLYHLSKFGITDVAGWELKQDEKTPIIFARKIISTESILCNELKNGEIIRRVITPEMEKQELDESTGTIYDAWQDPLSDQIASTWFEYIETVQKDIITCYDELNDPIDML